MYNVLSRVTDGLYEGVYSGRRTFVRHPIPQHLLSEPLTRNYDYMAKSKVSRETVNFSHEIL